MGGYLPFGFEITPFLKEGENRLSVVVQDETDPAYPYGKQKIKRGGMWYTPVSGIWQTVFLEVVPQKHIEGIRTLTTQKGVEITVLGGEEEKTLISTPFWEKSIPSRAKVCCYLPRILKIGRPNTRGFISSR